MRDWDGLGFDWWDMDWAISSYQYRQMAAKGALNGSQSCHCHSPGISKYYISLLLQTIITYPPGWFPRKGKWSYL